MLQIDVNANETVWHYG